MKKAEPNLTKLKPKKTAKKDTPKKTASQSRNAEYTRKSRKDVLRKHLNLLSEIEGFKDMKIEKQAYAVFLGLPESIRGKQKEFGADWKISEQTLSAWKHDPVVKNVRETLMKNILMDKTPAVLEMLYNGTQRTNLKTGLVDTSSIELWLQYVEGWKKGQDLDVKSSGVTVEFAVPPSPFMTGEIKKEKAEQRKKANP